MKVDTETIADALAYCEAHCDNDDETRLVEWVTEHVSAEIKHKHPRFRVGTFQSQANPIRLRGLRAWILDKVGPAHA